MKLFCNTILQRILPKENFKLTKKISKTMFRLYSAVYITVLLLLLVFILPPLYCSADLQERSTLDLVANDFTNAMSIADGYFNFLQKEIEEDLEAYEVSHSDSSKAKAELSLSNFVSNQSLLLAASVEDFDHNYLSSNFYRNIVNQQQLQSDSRYQHLFEVASGSYYSYLSQEDFVADLVDSGHHVMLFSKIKYWNHQAYVVTLYYDLNTVFENLEKLFDGNFSDFAILTTSGNTLYYSGERFTKEMDTISELFEYHLAKDSLNAVTGKYYYQRNLNSGWIFLTYCSYPMMLSDALTIIGIIMALYLLSPVLYSMLLMPVVNRLLAPLKQLYLTMKNYTPEKPGILCICTDDEIEELGDIFNEMQERISLQISDIRHKEHINAVTNSKLLATQIDPHFIYNTMNIINIMARQGRDGEIIEVNSALIKILRDRLSSKLSILCTIAQEVDSLYQYQLIMRYRYENKVEVVVDVDSTLMEKKIPKNILQPLAENAFYHGFANLPDDQEGLITILIYSIEENIIIELSDNGAGISEERLKILQNHSYQIYADHKPHIGLDNIRQRLDYIYHGDYQFEIQSTLGYGTTIVITVPINPPNAEFEN